MPLKFIIKNWLKERNSKESWGREDCGEKTDRVTVEMQMKER